MNDFMTIVKEEEKLRISFHAGQEKAWDSKKREIFIVAGTQSGKTALEPVWLDREIRECGQGDYLAVTASYDLFKLKFLPEMLHYFQGLFRWGYSAAERVIWKKNKPRMFTRIILRSAEADGGLESATAKAAIFDECGQNRVRIGAYDAIKRRLSLSRGRLLGATTPYNLGWLKTEIYDPFLKGDPNIQVVQFSSIMNPVFPKAEYYERKAKMPAWKFEMFYNGNFSRPAGLIYDNFDDMDVVPRFAIPDSWPRFLGLDFGLVNLAAGFYTQEPNTNRLYRYRTYRGSGFSVAKHVENLMKGEPRIPFCVGGSKSEGNWRKEFRACGLPVREPDIKLVEVGIDRVYEAHAEHMLQIFEDELEYLDEKRTYARKLDERDEPTDEIEDKETFHLMDAERYIIGYLKRKGVKAKQAQGDFYSKPKQTNVIIPAHTDDEIERMLKEYENA